MKFGHRRGDLSFRVWQNRKDDNDISAIDVADYFDIFADPSEILEPDCFGEYKPRSKKCSMCLWKDECKIETEQFEEEIELYMEIEEDCDL